MKMSSAIFDENMNVLSLVTDPNVYSGPGTGYQMTPERQHQVDTIRQQRSVADLLSEQQSFVNKNSVLKNNLRQP